MTSSNGNISTLLATGEFPAQRPVKRSFNVFFDLPLNKRLSKQWWSWWFETPSRPLWRHSNGRMKTIRIIFSMSSAILQAVIAPERGHYRHTISDLNQYSMIDNTWKYLVQYVIDKDLTILVWAFLLQDLCLSRDASCARGDFGNECFVGGVIQGHPQYRSTWAEVQKSTTRPLIHAFLPRGTMCRNPLH